MSRYADQLPIITEPTPGNYLLGTDENDPKALVRIPAEGLGNGGGSTEYTILDETALDVDSNVALSAGLYLYVGNAPANFDLSGLVDGERVEIINHTAHKIYLFGFDNWVWNGISTALQENKGLILEKGGLIGAKHDENLLLFNTLPNGLSQYWREKLLPPGFVYWLFQWNGNLSEIQFDVGDGVAKRLTPGLNNVSTLTEISGFVNTSPNFLAISDGILSNNNSQYIGVNAGANYCSMRAFFDVPKMLVEILVSPQGSATNIYNAPSNLIVSNSQDAVNWLVVKNIALGTGGDHLSPFANTMLRPNSLIKFPLY
jgi:hypothetical protein